MDFLSLIQPTESWAPGKPGFFILPEDVYRSAPGESQTGLKPILQSGKHYQYYKRKPFTGSDASRFGTLMHGLWLEGWDLEPADHIGPAMASCSELLEGIEATALFDRVVNKIAASDAYVIAPKCNKSTTAGKAEYAAFCAANEGRIILDQAGAARVQKWAEAALEALAELRSDPGLETLLAHSPPVCRELAWFCQLEGVWCKGRIDFVSIMPDGSLVIGDLKITTDCDGDSWVRKVVDFGYDFQEAMYCQAVKQLAGLDYTPDFVWIVQESTGPWCHNCWMPSKEMREMGWEKVVRALTLIERARKSGDWGGYPRGLKVLEPKPWQLKSWQKEESV